MKNKIVFLIVILFLPLSCSRDDETTLSKAGYFFLTEIQNAALKSTQPDENVRTTFSLGDVKASKEFFFILSNGGENPIFDIMLKTNNPAFTIMPENISILNGKSSTGNDILYPLITLGVIHGTQLNGVGYTELLPLNENDAILTITGKTIEGKDTIDLKSDFNFTVNAKRMDINLYNDGNLIDLLNPQGTASFSINFGGLGNIRLYTVTSSGNIRLENTGNVDIAINQSVMLDGGSFMKMDVIALPQDQFVDIYFSDQHTVFSLDSKGTITDDARIQLGNDGNGYFAIMRSYDYNPPDSIIDSVYSYRNKHYFNLPSAAK